MESLTLPRPNFVARVRHAFAALVDNRASARAARRARYRLLVQRYRLRHGDGVAPQTNELFTLIAQAHDASRALTRSTRREARRRSFGERIRDKIRGTNYYFVGLGLVGLAGMLLTAVFHLGVRAGLVFTLIWLAGTIPYVVLEGVALLVRIGLDLSDDRGDVIHLAVGRAPPGGDDAIRPCLHLGGLPRSFEQLGLVQ